jgi:hypothetical protein
MFLELHSSDLARLDWLMNFSYLYERKILEPGIEHHSIHENILGSSIDLPGSSSCRVKP